jgi:hypothetical protein
MSDFMQDNTWNPHGIIKKSKGDNMNKEPVKTH